MSQSPRNEPPRRKSLAQEFMIPGLIFGCAIVVAILVLLLTGGPDNNDGGADAGGNMISEALLKELETGFDPHGVSEGAADAKVVIREFADYQCPACAIFEPTARQLREEYSDNPNVRFVFFSFPLRSHQHARGAAEAAFCAEQRGKFWAYHEKLFEKQQSWSRSGDPRSAFMDMAVETGIPLNPFRQCLEQGQTEERVNKSAMAAAQAGISSTPTTMVGREVFAGVTPIDKLKASIERQLNR